MKKLILFLGLLCLPFAVNADEKNKFVTDFDDNIIISDNVNGSAIYGANFIEGNNNIEGVGIFLGNNINLNSTVQYGVIAGNNITIDSNFTDGLIMGNVIHFDASVNVARDILILGNEVIIQGKIDRDITIYASNIIIENATINGKLIVDSDNLTIKDDVSINKLSYNELNNVIISDKALISNTNIYEKEAEEFDLADTLVSYITSLLALFVIFTITYWLLPKLYNRFEEKQDVMKDIGLGLLFLILIPIIVLVLLCSVLGIGLGLLLIAFYIMIIATSTIITGYILGINCWKKYVKKNMRNYLIGLLGITGLFILVSLPLIGGIIKFISILFASGVIIGLFKKKEKKKA